MEMVDRKMHAKSKKNCNRFQNGFQQRMLAIKYIEREERALIDFEMDFD